MHPLTERIKETAGNDIKLFFGAALEDVIDREIYKWTKEQAEDLERRIMEIFPDGGVSARAGTQRAIQQSFQIQPSTLEEKFQEIREKHLTETSIQEFWVAIKKELFEAAKEHFKNEHD